MKTTTTRTTERRTSTRDGLRFPASAHRRLETVFEIAAPHLQRIGQTPHMIWSARVRFTGERVENTMDDTLFGRAATQKGAVIAPNGRHDAHVWIHVPGLGKPVIHATPEHEATARRIAADLKKAGGYWRTPSVEIHRPVLKMATIRAVYDDRARRSLVQ